MTGIRHRAALAVVSLGCLLAWPAGAASTGAAAGVDRPANSAIERIPFRSVTEEMPSPPGLPRYNFRALRVFGDSGSLARYLIDRMTLLDGSLRPISLDPAEVERQLPAVDYTREMVAIAAVGARPNGCYGVRVARVVRRGGSIEMVLREHGPQRGQLCAQALVHPATVVAVPRLPDRMKLRIISAQPHGAAGRSRRP